MTTLSIWVQKLKKCAKPSIKTLTLCKKTTIFARLCTKRPFLSRPPLPVFKRLKMTKSRGTRRRVNAKLFTKTWVNSKEKSGTGSNMVTECLSTRAGIPTLGNGSMVFKMGMESFSTRMALNRRVNSKMAWGMATATWCGQTPSTRRKGVFTEIKNMDRAKKSSRQATSISEVKIWAKKMGKVSINGAVVLSTKAITRIMPWKDKEPYTGQWVTASRKARWRTIADTGWVRSSGQMGLHIKEVSIATKGLDSVSSGWPTTQFMKGSGMTTLNMGKAYWNWVTGLLLTNGTGKGRK